jgi:hypothetical protein
MTTKAKPEAAESTTTAESAEVESLTPTQYNTLKLKETDLKMALTMLEGLFPPFSMEHDADLVDPIKLRFAQMKKFEAEPPAQAEPPEPLTRAEQRAADRAEERAEHKQRG